ncbi:hypothetical protein G7067_11000 [Leucobacter insecticola]|uniref:UvrD-like helicase ATP-binding domain-containing protein n=1 Tax=Leucobacter insecticola TaxID=2714934 RepID=A0A6G8FKA9_9MICO|nr:UvrD-helicase domain-containing protein [Leucobacter insecticola]QIM16807.1 hypothetical protein G7067_11000 [Leucobacter insecticola]
MTLFDPSQMRVLELDPERHARILGAPGSGKTRVLIEAFRRSLQLPGWDEQDVLVLASNRLVAAGLRPRLEHALGRAFGGTPVRTAASLSFAILSRIAAIEGEAGPRLLTGTVQDEVIAQVVAALLEPGAAETAGLVPEVLHSPTFRAELRELWRVTDDFGVTPGQLNGELTGLLQASRRESHTRLPAAETVDRWQWSLGIIERVAAVCAAERPKELSSSALLREAAAVVAREGSTRGVGSGSHG